MEWTRQTFGPHPGTPGREERTPTGVFRFPPKPPSPKRDGWMAVSDATDWQGGSDHLVAFWLKVAEVLPAYYRGDAAPDPLADQPPETVAADNGWDRVVCLFDVVYGKVTTNLWNGAEPPDGLDRAWVIVRFPWIDRAYRALPERRARAGGDALVRQTLDALADATGREPASKALAGLRRWRAFELWGMAKEAPRTLRPLQGRAGP